MLFLFYSPKPIHDKPRPDLQLDELEGVAMLYDTIRDIHKKKNPEKDHELAHDFDQHLQRVMQKLGQTYQSSNASQAFKTANALKAKYDLYDISLSKLIELIEMDNPETGQLLGDIHGGIHRIISSFYDISMVDPLTSSNSNTPQSKDVQKYQQENKKLIGIMESMENEIKKLKISNEQLANRFDEEKAEMHEQITSLESENKMYLDTLIKHCKGEIPNIGGVLNSRSSNRDVPIETSGRSGRNTGQENLRTYQKSPPKIAKTKEFTYSKFNSGRNNRSVTGSGGSGNRSYKPGGATAMGVQTQMRNLSLKQLKDIITDIYNQKVKHDQKCNEEKKSRETMEQYMYTYLNQRYGLKNLIIEWAASIINGIK